MKYQDLKKSLRTVPRIAVLTGAGISAESGVPTFRGKEGLWKTYRPEDLATMGAFMSHPEQVWEWYRFRQKQIREIRPNAGHLSLARLEAARPEFTLITQNVDGLHQRAGSRNVIEIHGNILRTRCVRCGKTEESPSMQNDTVPVCACGGRLRPDVVWFGEMLPANAMEAAWKAAETCGLFLVVGTSARVYPAAHLPLAASRAGAAVVEINTEETPVSEYADLSLLGKAGDILSDLVNGM